MTDLRAHVTDEPTEAAPCELCGSAPSIALTQAPLSLAELRDVDLALDVRGLQRLPSTAPRLAVCSICESIVDAAIRGEIPGASAA